MVGANAATNKANAVLVGRPSAAPRQGLAEQMVSRYRAHVARTQAEQLARMTWMDDARHRSSDQGGVNRDLGSTPLRGVRLT